MEASAAKHISGAAQSCRAASGTGGSGTVGRPAAVTAWPDGVALGSDGAGCPDEAATLGGAVPDMEGSFKPLGVALSNDFSNPAHVPQGGLSDMEGAGVGRGCAQRPLHPLDAVMGLRAAENASSLALGNEGHRPARLAG